MNFLLKNFSRKSFLCLQRLPVRTFAFNVQAKDPQGEKKSASYPFNVVKWKTETNLMGNKKEKLDSNAKNESSEEASEDENHFGQSNNRLLQNRITNTHNANALFELFMENKNTMDLINVCTCLDKIVKLNKRTPKDKIQKILNEPELNEMIQHLKNNIENMNGFTASNFLSNLAKLNLIDYEFLDNFVQRIFTHKVQLDQKSLGYIVWALAKCKVKNKELLDILAKEIKQTTLHIKPKTFCNIFWGLSELEYHDKDIVNKMEAYISNSSLTFDYIDINLVFAGYNNYCLKRVPILDILSQYIISNIERMSLRNIANITSYCANLDYNNKDLLDTIQKEILKRLSSDKNVSKDRFAKTKGQIRPSTADGVDLLDLSQLLVSFNTLKVDNTELLQLLEDKSKQQLYKASPRVFNTVIGSFLTLRGSNFQPEEALALLNTASKNLVMERISKKDMVEFGIKIIPKFERLRKQLSTSEFEKFVFDFNYALQKFVYHIDQTTAIKESFMRVGVDLNAIDKLYSNQKLQEDQKPADASENKLDSIKYEDIYGSEEKTEPLTKVNPERNAFIKKAKKGLKFIPSSR